MTEFRERYGNWALIAGAAIGLGESFCVALAKQGINLFMIDNLEEKLMNLSGKLAKAHGIQTIPFCIDLFQTDAVEQIMAKTSAIEIRLMLYVAAFSQIKKFGNYTSNDLEHYININVSTPLKLIHSFSNRLMQRNQPGGILLMSSLAGLLGMQYIAPYAATKAFTWNLAESLHHELKPYKIDVMACIAGATATDAYLGTNPKYGFIKPQVQQPSEVAELALKRIGKKALFIPGFSNWLNFFILTRILPRKMASHFANRTMKKMYSENVKD
jgi:short-subunit dehydrogenase